MRLGIFLLAAFAALGCGARTGLVDDSGTSGGATCAPKGDTCTASDTCCDGRVCTGGRCEDPPSACANDTGPVKIGSGLTDPYALAGDASYVYVGQLDKNLPILRIPKTGGDAFTVVADVSFVDYMALEDGSLFFAGEHALESVPAGGGARTTIASAAGAGGFALTADRALLADYLGKELISIDRATHAETVLAKQQDGVYRVSILGASAFFSIDIDGLRRVPLAGGKVDVLGGSIGPARAVMTYGDAVYYTTPYRQKVWRLHEDDADPVLVTNLTPLGTFPEALVTDGDFLYLTLVRESGPGYIVRAPIDGGDAEVVVSGGGLQPSALVVDGSCLYWTERDLGVVYRARKVPLAKP